MSTQTTIFDVYQASATEGDMLKTITDAVDRVGGVWYRVRDSRAQAMDGFPDILCLVPDAPDSRDIALLGFELKTKRDRKRPAQEDFIHYLNATVRCHGAFVRAGVPLPDEISIDDALAMIQGATAQEVTR